MCDTSTIVNWTGNVVSYDIWLLSKRVKKNNHIDNVQCCKELKPRENSVYSYNYCRAVDCEKPWILQAASHGGGWMCLFGCLHKPKKERQSLWLTGMRNIRTSYLSPQYQSTHIWCSFNYCLLFYKYWCPIFCSQRWMIRMGALLFIYIPVYIYYRILCMNKFNLAPWSKLDYWVGKL